MSEVDAVDEPGPFHCHKCDVRTWNEPDMHSYCDSCRTDHMAAHATGYAEAVADIVAEIRRHAMRLSLARRAIVPELMRLAESLEGSVGAAKKNGQGDCGRPDDDEE